tara:strand:+ start:501 stop:626 length:126 start_codon:yes stop_codon:yes gene_type:complete
MDITRKAMSRPIIGVATTWNETASCNIILRRKAQVTKEGVE